MSDKAAGDAANNAETITKVVRICFVVTILTLFLYSALATVMDAVRFRDLNHRLDTIEQRCGKSDD